MSVNLKKSIVVGGGIAGMLCARVLSDFSDEVLIIEKEKTPEEFASRKGVPQGFHNHTLLDSGKKILNSYFPGFSGELLKNDNIEVDQTAGLKWFHHGVLKFKDPTDLKMNVQSRWHIEGLIRKRLSDIQNISWIQDKVIDIQLDSDTVSGVKCESQSYEGDLVIDCSGQAGGIRHWLQKNDFPPPPELRIKIDLKYSSFLFKREADEVFDWKCLAIYPEAPHGKRSGVMFPVIDHEHGPCWLVTAVGRLGEYPGSTFDEFIDFLKGLDLPDMYEFLKNKTPLTEKAHVTSFQENIRSYFDHLLRYPSGLLVCGDSFGRINPIFGQGMSIAAIESEILQKTLEEVSDLKTLTSLYLKRIGCFFDIPWFLVNCEDWRYPETPHRSKGIKLINWYTGKLHKLCAKDKQVVSEMYNVLHFNKKPLALFKPSIVFKALFKRV